jgi:hypothetical protein
MVLIHSHIPSIIPTFWRTSRAFRNAQARVVSVTPRLDAVEVQQNLQRNGAITWDVQAKLGMGLGFTDCFKNCQAK